MANRRCVTKQEIARLGVPNDFDTPLLLVFKMVSDNGANMKAAWYDGERWVSCSNHSLELCTLPVTWVEKRKKDDAPRIEKGSVPEAYAHGRGIVGFLHVSTNATTDFHAAQKLHNLVETTIDLDVKTRWRTAHDMGEQLLYNKAAILEMDKNPSYKDAGETWGKNKLTMTMWDYIEQGTAVLDQAASVSTSLEGDKYPTSSLVVPMMYKLMATSAATFDLKFTNRSEDEFNDESINPVIVPGAQLHSKIQAARAKYHENLVDRFDTHVPLETKKFWFISTMCDPRFKKLSFKNDGMITDASRRKAERWFKDEFVKKYKGKFFTSADEPDAQTEDGGGGGTTVAVRHVKKRKANAAAFFAASDSDEPDDAEDEPAEAEDELTNYLNLPQIKYKTEWDALEWCKEHQPEFPNLSVMARQFLGCPASSATVERLFSKAGISFSRQAQVI